MSILTFSSLKGGVGKTSLTINVGHAFASQDCKTLLIDLDPQAHATRLLEKQFGNERQSEELPLARVLWWSEEMGEERHQELLERALDVDPPLLVPVRENFDLLRGGEELRHFFGGEAQSGFAHFSLN